MVLTPGPPSSSPEPSTTCLVAMKIKYKSSEWIKINPGVVGYYRVNYDPEEAKSLETSTRYELRTVFTLSAV